MNIDEIISAIGKWSKDFERMLEALEKGMERRVERIQAKYLDEMRKVIEWLALDGRAIQNNASNIGVLRRLEGMFDLIQRDAINRELEQFAAELVSVGQKTAGYYEATGFAANADSVLDTVREVVGVDRNGNLLREGYLYKLGRSDEVRARLRDYVLQSIVQKRNLSQYQKGLGELVAGTDGADGLLKRYWRQYAFDTFNQVHEIANKTLADQLELKWFIYQGSVIPTTRDFCRKRAGKVFEVQETKTWKNDPDLIDKKTKESYNPLVERGRYNCRHFLNYVSEDVAKQLRK